MTNEEKQEAAELAKRSVVQAKNASKNAGRAAKVVAEPVAEEALDTADNAMDAVRRINPQRLSGMASDIGMGFFALSVSIWGAAHAINKFRGVAAGRNITQ